MSLAQHVLLLSALFSLQFATSFAAPSSARLPGWPNIEFQSWNGFCILTPSGGDDASAFAAALGSSKCSTVVVPFGSTLQIRSPLNTTATFNKHISLEGTLSYSDDVAYWNNAAFKIAYQNSSAFWLLGGENILLDGGGTIQGNGQAWYNAFAANAGIFRPILLTVSGGKNVKVQNLKALQAPFWHFFITGSTNVEFDGLYLYSNSTNSTILAKNTDGWDIYRSSAVVIQNSQITNGDDCVSFKPNATDITVSNLVCTGSHGISVGSLGQYPGEYDIIEDIYVSNVRMSNAQNGIRIKSFAGPDVGYGKVNNIHYDHWQGDNIDYPIIIDSCYETTTADCEAYPSKVPISNVYISNVNGSSSGNEKSLVVDLACSPGNQTCTNINLNNITITPPAKSESATYICQNAQVFGNAASLFNCTTT